WVIEKLVQPDHRALTILRRWTNRQRHSEITPSLLKLLRDLSPEACRIALRELKQPRRWIRRINESSVILPIVIKTLDDQRSFELDALLDCGATGCYIDEGYAKAKGINLTRLHRPIPVYNA
ncbi:hypothetical protein BJ138DRAFT_970249, partial [Hygrophoropsis aurantiaca]